MNISIVYRVLFFALLLSLNLPLYSQLDDIGTTLDSEPRYTVRDSLEYLIYEGESPAFFQTVEGGAIELVGEEIESVSFRLFGRSGAYKTIPGKIFTQPDINKVATTFLELIENVPAKFSFKIVSRESIEINSILIFPVDQEKPGRVRALEPTLGDISKPVIISREEWGAEDPKGSYS